MSKAKREPERWQKEVAATLDPYIGKVRTLLPELTVNQATQLLVDLWIAGIRPMYTKYIRECAACKKELVLPEDDDNALCIRFTGGYAMFVDDYDATEGFERDNKYEAWLCHECAHAMCAAVKWMNEVIQPHKSHSHTQAYHEAHPDHEGWDYDLEKERK